MHDKVVRRRRAVLALLVALALELVALVRGVERVTEPPEQVAGGLERLVGPLLDLSLIHI